MADPAGYKYTNDHEWVDISDATARIGITDYAQQQLGDVVFVDLPEVGSTFQRGQTLGTIESVKAVSELFAPMSGQVVEVNTTLKDKPEALNTEPYDAWMVALKLTDPGEASALLDAAQYAGMAK